MQPEKMMRARMSLKVMMRRRKIEVVSQMMIPMRIGGGWKE